MPEKKRSTRKIGREQEERAARYLEQNGCRILEHNFSGRFGEIDLIAADQETLVFVEVKFRKDPSSFDPALAVNRKKQEKISKTADYYRAIHRIPSDVPCRFDVVAETEDGIRWYQDAFPYRGTGW